MSFKISDRKLLKNCTKMWERVRSLTNTKFDSEPVYGDSAKYINTKIKTYGNKINTNFQDKKIPKENLSYKCLSLIMLDSVIRTNEKYYPQTLLEECKCEVKKNKTANLINNDFDTTSSDESYSELDSEPDSETDSEPDNESDKNKSND